MHTRKLRYIDTVGTVIISGGLEDNFVVVRQSVCDSQPSTNIKGGRSKLKTATICWSGVISCSVYILLDQL